MSSRSPTRAPDLVAMYTRVAAIYDAWTWLLERRSLLAALDRAAIRDGEAVLEIAVGTGLVFREVLRRNPSGRNAGIDLTEAMLRRARRKAERAGVPFSLEVGDARRLAFDDASFDVVLSNNMLGLLPPADIAAVLRAARRVLRPGGRLVLVTMLRPERRAPRWIYQLGAMRLGGWSDVVLEPFVRAAGLEDVRREVVTQLGFPSEILSARRPGRGG
jgi:ubiquinone/menaquinone biosynthesis C-methylase UbiE